MRKQRYPTVYNSADEVPKDLFIVTYDDLEGQELEIYHRYLPQINQPSPDQLRMLATFAWLAVELKKSVGDKKLALYIRQCMIFARNRLGIWKPEPIRNMALLLNEPKDEDVCYCLYLDPHWEIEDSRVV